MIIAVDGPAASGKGTVSDGLAQHYRLPNLDTGLLYRAVGLATFDRLEDPALNDLAIAAAQNLDFTALDPVTLGRPEIAVAASNVARIPEVRSALFQLQQDFARQDGGAILDGRDIGTRICPDADVKLFVTATPEVRATRRTNQLIGRGQTVQQSDILAQIIARDERDRENPAGAFYLADDAHLLDTTDLSIEAALRAAVAIVDKAMAGKTG